MGKTIHNRIKSVLAEKNQTSKNLADALGVTVETVSTWCTNSHQPSLKTLFEIATILDIDVRLLLVSNKP